MYRLLRISVVTLIGIFICLSVNAQTQTLRLTPLTSTDDAEQGITTGTMYLNSSDLELGGYDWGSNLKQSTGIRFPNVTLPQGATITKAYIQFSVDETYVNTANTANITIKAQKGNAATYTTTANNISSRTYTTANVTWATTAWTVLDQRLAAQQTPDLKALIVEAMQTGFVSGNALAFCFTTTTNGYATAYAVDRAAAHAPELIIEYTTPTTLCTTATNLALGKSASQSSIASNGSANRAVDGNISGNWYDNSITHTNGELNSWWQVDLGQVSNIDVIKLFNRTDCCSDRLSNFYVLVSEVPFVSTDLITTLDQNNVKSYDFPGVAGAQTDIPLGVKGRYVRIQLKTANYLSLAEVQVMGCDIPVPFTALCSGTNNLALGKPTSQSSMASGGLDSRAVDGNISGNWYDNSITHTNGELNSWWQVDLGQLSNIDVVKLFNRTDCCGDRLSNFYILVSEVPFTSTDLTATLAQSNVKSYYFPGVVGAQTDIPLGVKGRYVRVQLKTANYLSLAEVQVMGCDVPVARTKLSNIFINEATGSNTIANNLDWVEIFNNNTVTVNLDSVYVTDDKNIPNKFMFRSRNLVAKSFVLVNADDTLTNYTATSAAFGISAKGETVYLFQQFDGVLTLLDSLVVGATETNTSYGRFPDASSTIKKFSNPTPSVSNNGSKELVTLSVSHQRGLYSAAFNLTVIAPPGMTIRYTTDGSTPTAAVGTLYTAPINISKSTAIKVYAYDATRETRVMTQTYLFFSDVATQVGVTLAEVEANLKAIPIVNITTSPNSAFTRTESPCSFEYINTFGENKSAFADAGVKQYGGLSPTGNKINLRFFFRTDYGYSKLKHPIFAPNNTAITKPVEEFDNLELKLGHDVGSAWVPMSYLSEMGLHGLMQKINNQDVYVRPVNVFYNGVYQGIQFLRERYDNKHGEAYYGGDKTTYDVIEDKKAGFGWSGVIANQGGATWKKITDAIAAKKFQDFKKYVDVKNTIDFMLLLISFDFESEMAGYVHQDALKSKLKLFHNDTDGMLLHPNSSTPIVWKLTDIAITNGPAGIFTMTGINGNTVNREYQTLTKDRVEELYIQPTGAMTVAQLKAHMNAVKQKVIPAIGLELKKWNKGTFANWDAVTNAEIGTIDARIGKVIQFLTNQKLVHSIKAVTYSKPSGESFLGERIYITNPNAGTAVYYTTDGTDVVLDNTVSPTAKLYNASTGIELPLGKTKIRARAYNGTDNFGMYADAEYLVTRPIKITAIAYQPNPIAPAADVKTNDVYEFFNLTNTGTTPIDISNFMVTEAIDTFRLPQGTSLAVGETIMLCSDDTKYPSVQMRKFKWTKGKLDNAGENISFRDSLGNLINEVRYDTLTPWPYAKGNGAYIRLKALNLDNKIGSNWEAVSLTPLLTTGALNSSTQLVFTAQGRQEVGNAVITWVSNANKQADYYVLEKMDADKQTFEKLAIVNAQYSTQDAVFQYYTFTDDAPKKDTVTYRVGMVLDKNSTPQYAAPITLNFSQFMDYVIYPNPVTDIATLDLGNALNQKATIIITDLTGKPIVQQAFEKAPTTLDLDLSHLPVGQYFIHFEVQGKRSVMKKLAVVR